MERYLIMLYNIGIILFFGIVSHLISLVQKGNSKNLFKINGKLLISLFLIFLHRLLATLVQDGLGWPRKTRSFIL
jgi:hypothetical protein